LREGVAPLAPGYRTRILDGNHLPASQKRLGPLRDFRGAALPGQSLVVYDPDLDLIVDLEPGEDGHAQERTMLPAVLARTGEQEVAEPDGGGVGAEHLRRERVERAVEERRGERALPRREAMARERARQAVGRVLLGPEVVAEAAVPVPEVVAERPGPRTGSARRRPRPPGERVPALRARRKAPARSKSGRHTA
jgi:hypothetical protein